jgi:methyl-accepting chemotaxis protein
MALAPLPQPASGAPAAGSDAKTRSRRPGARSGFGFEAGPTQGEGGGFRRSRFRSLRAKLLLLVGGVLLLVSVVSAGFELWSSGKLLREQINKRGRYIANNLAYNSKYGVLTEDKPLLTQLLEGALSAGGEKERSERSDVVGAMIRDGKGNILAHRGMRIRDLPSEPARTATEIDAVTEENERVILFRAPVTTSSSGDVAAELGITGSGRGEEQKGGVEVAISKSIMAAQQRSIFLTTTLLAALLFVLGSVGGWYLTGVWLTPVREMVSVASAVIEGDLTESLAVNSDDEVGALAQRFNEMVANLRRIVDNIQETSVQVASSAGEISANAKLITQGAQAQAQAAEETSTSMEEMAASIQTVAGNAQSLATYVEETSTSITEMGASIEEVARSSGTLASTVTEASATIEQMTVSIDQMARNLENLAATVTQTSSTVEEMTSFIASVAHNAEALGSAAMKASHTVAELASAVNDVAKIAEEADRISKRASEDARTGDEAVGRTITGMRTISETMENTARVITGLGRRSQEIGKILEVIEEIADQTNLLALNAAIEAARAGEAGRGFAVVADEVRKLAERSVEATKEIGEVIRQVQQETTDAVETAKAGAAETKEGIGLADRAGLALRSIIESVGRSSQLMAEIASATAKQSSASAEVLQTVSNMNSATSQVTTAVREQAEGSKQIRQAMENINRIMTQAAYSTKEQAAGGRQVRMSVENMNKIASQVNIATKEQAEGSRQIVHAVENMNRMTQQVSYATAEQKRGGELVVKAMENISEIARDNLSTVEEMSKATGNLAQQAENLAKLISVFRVE